MKIYIWSSWIVLVFESGTTTGYICRSSGRSQLEGLSSSSSKYTQSYHYSEFGMSVSSNAMYRKKFMLMSETVGYDTKQFRPFQFIREKVFNVVSFPSRKARQVKRFFGTELPMLRFLWPKDDIRLRFFLILSMIFMFLGKWVNVQVPFVLQRAIDDISTTAATVSTAKASVGVLETGWNSLLFSLGGGGAPTATMAGTFNETIVLGVYYK